MRWVTPYPPAMTSLPFEPHATEHLPTGASCLTMGVWEEGGVRPAVVELSPAGWDEFYSDICEGSEGSFGGLKHSELLGLLPQWARKILEPLPAWVWWRTLQLLHCALQLRRDRAIAELAATDLVLVALLATSHQRCPVDLVHADVARNCGQPRVVWLAFLGLPRRRWILRILRKVRPDCLEDDGREQLLHVLASEDRNVVRLLQHLEEITPEVLLLLDHPTLGSRVGPPFICEVSVEAASARGLRPESWAAIEWARSHEEKLVDCFKSIGQLIRLKERADQECTRLPGLETDIEGRHGPLAPAPSGAVTLEGGSVLELTPLTTHEAVVAWGRTASNCLCTHVCYRNRAESGELALYRVSIGAEEPLIATLALAGHAAGWEVEEFEISEASIGAASFDGEDIATLESEIEERLEAWASELPPPPPPPAPRCSLDLIFANPPWGESF